MTEAARHLRRLTVLLLGFALTLAGFELHPDDQRVVHDGGGHLSAASEDRITDWILALHRQTGVQLKVATWGDLGSHDLFTACQEQFEHWHLGSREHDDGVIVAMGGREARIQTGYGLEGELPDSWCGSTVRAAIDRHFRRGDHAGGIEALVAATAQKIASSRGVRLQAVPASQLRTGRDRPQSAPQEKSPWSMVWGVVLVALFPGLVLVLFLVALRWHTGSWSVAFKLANTSSGSQGDRRNSGGSRGSSSSPSRSFGDGRGGGFRGGGGRSGGGGGGGSW